MGAKNRVFINAGQIRAARAVLDWSQDDLAEHSGLSVATIRKIESGHLSPRGATMQAIASAMESAKVEFIAPMGVNLRTNDVTVIESDESYSDLMENIWQTLREKGGEVLFMFCNNAVASDEQVELQIKMRKAGIRFRFLCEEGNTYMHYPLAEYRWVPKQYYKSNLQIVYGNKVAVCLYKGQAFEKVAKVIVVESPALAETTRNTFEFFWDNSRKPSHSTAPEIFR